MFTRRIKGSASSRVVIKLSVKVKNVCMSYRAKATGQPVKVLENVNFTLRKGEFTVLLGPSGCGKTTLLNLIAGLDTATGGSIVINGRPVREPGRHTAFVFQEAALFPWLTMLENVIFAMREGTKPEKESKAICYLRQMRLEKYIHAYPHQLSGGMKQRAAIARALAVESELLLMDEPFASLDEQTRFLLQAELTSIWQKTAQTLIFVTHSIREAIYLADRIFILGGRPGTIRHEFIVGCPRPRAVSSRTAIEMETEIMKCIREDFERMSEQLTW